MFKVRTFIATIIFSLVFSLAFTGGANAETITKDMIARQYAEMEKVLNEHSDAMEVIRFLHDHISDNAQFRVSVASPMADNGRNSPVMELSKTDYINSYIQGAMAIEDYKMHIQTVKFEAGEGGAYTTDIMTERGTMPSAIEGRGKDFVSRTTCRTRHEMKDGKLVAASAECHTDISFEEEI